MSDIFRDYSFGGWFRSFRVKRQLTLREVSKRLKCSASHLSKLELSRLDPPCSAVEIDKICRDLGFDEYEAEMLKSTAFSHHLGQLKTRFGERKPFVEIKA